MKLRTKMMYLAGTASFLVFAAVMGLFFLSFSIFSRQIRSDGMKYTDRDLQERARGSLLRLKDSMLTAYVRTSTFYAAVNLPGAELIKVLKTRFAYSRVSDAQFYCEFDGAADPVFTGFYGLVMKDGKPQETASFPSVTESAELKAFLTDPSPDFHTAFLFVGDETWVVHRVPGHKPGSGKLFAARLDLPYRGGLAQGMKSGYLLMHGDRVVAESYESLDRTVPPSVRAEIHRLAMKLNEGDGDDGTVMEVLSDAATDSRWYVSGICLKPSARQPLIRIVRLHDFDAVKPDLPKLLHDQERLLAALLVFITAAGLLLVLLPVFLISKQIADPIAHAAAFANKVAAGEFTAKPSAPCGIQEIDQLQKALDCMKDRLNAMIGKLKRSHAREKSARKEAENLNRVKTDFLGVLYEECREPLSSLSGFAALLRNRLKKKEPLTPEYMEPVLDAIKSGLRNISGRNEMMRELSVMDVAEAEPLSPQYRDTFQLFREQTGPMLRETRKRNVSIDFSFSSELPARIYVDSEKFLGMLNHITLALYRDLPPSSRILCTVSRQEDERFVICYSGSAKNTVPLEYMLYTSSRRPLQEFRNADPIIHLTIARYLAHLLGADFDVSAEEEVYSVSASFPLSVLKGPSGVHERAGASRPAGKKQAGGEEEEEALFHAMRGLPGPSGQPVRVLVAEDDEPNRLLFELMLREAGCEVMSRTSVHEVQKSLSRSMPDVLLLDLHMRDLDRFQFLSEIRQMPGGQDLFVIALSTRLEDSECSRLISAGADRCLPMPLDVGGLMEAIRGSWKEKH